MLVKQKWLATCVNGSGVEDEDVERHDQKFITVAWLSKTWLDIYTCAVCPYSSAFC